MTITSSKYRHALCTSCAAIVTASSAAVLVCDACGERVESPTDSSIYRYAEATIYYGYQYRTLFERQQGEVNPPKFSLSFLGEPFTFVGIAAISGVIGNFAYDVIKLALVRIRDQARERANHDPDYRALGDLTDEDLDRIYDYSRSYVQAFKDVEKTIRDDLLEEMTADCMGEAVHKDPGLLKLLGKRKISAKEQGKIVKAFAAALHAQPQADKPSESRFKAFWKKLGQK